MLVVYLNRRAGVETETKVVIFTCACSMSDRILGCVESA